MKPKVILHNAVSADGRIDWFQADVALFYALIQRFNEDATLGGSETLLNSPEEVPPDDPAKDLPPPPGPDDKRPLLVVPDSRGRIWRWGYWQNQPYWRACVVLVSKKTPKEYRAYLKERRIDTITAGAERVDYATAFEQLNKRYGVKTIRVDSGGTLNGALLRQGLVDEVSLLIHPSLIGGASQKSIFRAPDLVSRAGVIPLKVLHFERMENDILWIVWKVGL
jgi:2,5-diamino-6-(ribosylamino)-4(3H)-pyrimidinone 5'-phosphate reductase